MYLSLTPSSRTLEIPAVKFRDGLPLLHRLGLPEKPGAVGEHCLSA